MAAVISRLRIGDTQILIVDDDPTAAGGTAAAKGDLAVVVDVGVDASLWQNQDGTVGNWVSLT